MDIVVLNQTDLRKMLTIGEVIEDVRESYRFKALGQTATWPLVSYDFIEQNAVMDIRSGYLQGRMVHGLKMLNNFPHNREKGLPHFTGMLMVFDSETGLPSGILDASFITCMRTGAAGALGAFYLSKKEAENLLIVGAGNQALYLCAATLSLLPNIKNVTIIDPVSHSQAEQFVSRIGKQLTDSFGMDIRSTRFSASSSMEDAVKNSHIILTATPSRSPLINKVWVQPGTHFSCIGADMEGKEEIDPEIFRDAIVFTDDLDQCTRVGELEIPLEKGIIRKDDIGGEIGELIAGTKQGRKSPNDITIFDATGLAILDLAVAKSALTKAKESGTGQTVSI